MAESFLVRVCACRRRGSVNFLGVFSCCFFRLKGSLLRYYQLSYRFLIFPIRISYSFVLVGFCFKTSLIVFDRSSFLT